MRNIEKERHSETHREGVWHAECFNIVNVTWRCKPSNFRIGALPENGRVGLAYIYRRNSRFL